MQRIFSVLCGLATVALLLTGTPALAQSTPPRLIFQASIPGLRLNKFPDVAAFDRTVHFGTNNNRQDAVYLSKSDSSQSFSGTEVVGQAPGQADYSPVSIATGFDGSVHIAWINQDDRRLRYRTKSATGSFGPIREIVRAGGFPANITLDVASDGAIFVAWRESDRPHRVVRSTDGGQSWSNQYILSSRAGINFPFIVTGPGGRAAVAYTASAGNLLQIYVGIWNGGGFDIEQVSPENGDYADPSVAFDPDGNLYIAYRGTEDSSVSGVWFGTRAGTNQWQVSRLTDRSNVNDLVNIQSDPAGNLHLAWISNVSGVQRVFYSYRPRGGAFGNPVAASNPGGSIFNPRMDANIGDEAYAHVVTEFFQGDGSSSTVRYYLFGATSAAAVGADPIVEDNETITERESQVQVSFQNVRGQPTEIRWRWGAAPDATTSDSGGWKPFSNPMSIGVPDTVLNNTSCKPVTLFTQVRESDGDTGTVEDDAITFDTGITAYVVARNPFSRFRSSSFSSTASAEGLGDTPGLGEGDLADFGTEGANDGDVGHTRVPGAYVEVRGINECSGILSISTGRSSTSLGRSVPVAGEFYANVMGYPGVMALGLNQMVVRVTDKAGNFTDYTQSIIYDPEKPVLTSSAADSLSATSDPSATILARLAVKNVAVTDTYSGRGFWGVWVANSRTPVASPATDATLVWAPVEVPGSATSFNVNWSLATGLRASEVTTGPYYIYMRFLDGAGNATDGVISTTLTLNQVTRPRTIAPMVRR